MKARSAEELSDLLAKNLSRRKREITTLKFLIDRSHGKADQPVLLRSAIPLLYSHWEGFIKYASNAYISFVDHQALTYKLLIPSLVGLALRSAFLEAQQSPYNHGARTRVVKTIIERPSEQAHLPVVNLGKNQEDDSDESAISTSNLNSKVFFDILDLFSIETTQYEPKRVLIDEKLLKKRNKIAHGELLDVPIDDYNELHQEVIDLMGAFNIDITNSAVLRKYLHTAQSGVQTNTQAQ